MCGFGGILNSNHVIDHIYLSKIAHEVSFRGPDNTTLKIYDKKFNLCKKGSNGVFFNRLSILDLNQRSNQPFENERFILLFNGEIYNYKNIKLELEILKYKFNTTSDTEVLFYALIEWGTSCISNLNGMFSFVFIDKKLEKIILARDRVGIKPLYYKKDKNTLIFASELDSIIRLSLKKPKISKISIQHFLSLQYVPTPFTIYEDIYKLPPGTFTQVSIHELNSENSVEPKKYWDLYEICNETQCKENIDLENLLVESIKSQLQSDVPLGLFLSSGIDSSVLAAIINKYFNDGQIFNYFTVAFDHKTSSDESEDASQFINKFDNPNFIFHKLMVNSNTILESINTMYKYYDEPFGDYASLLNCAISFKAREYVTVALSGDGGDELFWGYPRYNYALKMNNSKYMGKLLKKRFQSLFNVTRNNSYINKIIKHLETDPIKIYLNVVALNYINMNSLEDVELWWYRNIETVKGRVDLPSIIDMKTYLPDAMLYKVDRSSMAASLEVRVPYLDTRIIDYALKLPFKKKSNEKFSTKAPLRELLLLLTPNYKIDMPKKGFNFPLLDWMNKEWREVILSKITKSTLEELGLDSQYFLDIVNKHYYKNIYNVSEIWNLFNLISWYNYKKNNLFNILS